MYDEKGNPAERDTYLENGGLAGKITFEFDNKARKVAEYRRGGGSKSAYKISYSYDVKGLKSEQAEWDTSGKLLSKTVFRYDEKGNPAAQELFRGDKLYGRVVFVCDERGNIITETTYSASAKGHVDKKITYEYDKRDNVTEERNYHSDGSTYFKTTYKYSDFDKEGNWQRQVTTKNFVPKLVTERELDYY